MALQRLRSRPQYRAVAKGKRVSRPGLVLQALAGPDADAHPRFGFTVTSKTGNAVIRNRIRRRLKAAALVAEGLAPRGTDFVVIGRREAVNRSFPRLVADLTGSFSALLAARKGPAEPAMDAAT